MKTKSFIKNFTIAGFLNLLVFLPLILLISNKLYDIDQIYVPQAWVESKRTSININDYELTQTFTSKENNLAGFDIAFDYIGDRDEVIVYIQLLENETREILESFPILDKDIDGLLHPLRVHFDPIKNSKGKEYLLKMIPSSAGEPYPQILASTYDTYLDGDIYIDGKVQEGDISFIPIYQSHSSLDFINTLSDRIEEHKPALFNSKGVLYLTLLTTVLLSFLLIFSFLPHIQDHQGHDANN